ncbi:Bug family tripartite tricarboxylate transporter substrate binding protein [Diaphorobacter ruginosibacter]|uniref:Bug family tripartite tricarboxylate transporter substrate binding protein n=1 Tax=Diaphorobacter ruginosibacter TaxID=1715720 RepID=UPI001FEBF7B5|nr:tripartite tricarboxylate transporter substrate binding protein [Diaphorobacter ruginosibacter]
MPFHLVRAIFTTAAGAMLALVAMPSQAQATCTPDRPVRLVVPFPAGGGTDIIARRLAEHLRQDLKQPVVVDNRAGASGNIGAENVAHAAPDGCTLMLTAAPFAIAPAVFKGLSFHPVKDFTAIAKVASVPLLVVTRADSPLKSMADLMEAARRKPDAISYGTFGTGAPPHLVGSQIQRLGNFHMTHVPYKGGQAALPDLLSGQLDIAIMDVVSMTPLIRAGRLRALAITGPQRTAALPDVPTLAQAGIAFDTVGWYAIFGPAKMDPATTARINQAANRAMKLPDMTKAVLDGGALLVDPPPTAEQWQAAFNDEVRIWGEVARSANISLD